MAQLVAVSDHQSAARAGSPFDAVILVSPAPAAAPVDAVAAALRGHAAIDLRSGADLAVLPVATAAGGRLVVAPTGPVVRDHDDVRRFADAAAAGVRRARDAGARAPLLIVDGLPGRPEFAHGIEVAALAAVGALWEPLEAREALSPEVVEPVATLGVARTGGAVAPELTAWVGAVEAGRRLARDLCGTEPERMAPPRFADYCRDAFAGLPVECHIEADPDRLLAGYPLLMAVARASMPVARHRPRVIRLVYTPDGPIERTVLLAGKGLTYDTGGADLKAGGVMAGMSRDKGGGAAVAGLVHAAASLGLEGVRVIAEIGAVRNSIGAECFVSDEIIRSHAGCRVRIGNTDAEGRLVLADLLSHLREDALGATAPRILSVATLTGHAGRAVGPYNIALDNGPARTAGIADALSRCGDLWGDPFDCSRLRREDFDFVAPRSRADDVLSCNNAPSTATARGHQFPMAFLAIASGLDHHGRDSDRPLPFTHIDIGGSAVDGGDWQHGRPNGRPVVGMLQALLAAR